jgi:ABC-type sugar transport system ATPase subunit
VLFDEPLSNLHCELRQDLLREIVSRLRTGRLIALCVP